MKNRYSPRDEMRRGRADLQNHDGQLIHGLIRAG